jgi:hypothetical protein
MTLPPGVLPSDARAGSGAANCGKPVGRDQAHATGPRRRQRGAGGHRRRVLERHEADFRRLVEATPDVTLAEFQTKLPDGDRNGGTAADSAGCQARR